MATAPAAPASAPQAPNPPHGGSWLRQPDGSLRQAEAPAAEPAAPQPAPEQ